MLDDTRQIYTDIQKPAEMRTKQTGRKAEMSEFRSRSIFTREMLIADEIKSTLCELLDGIESGCSFATFGIFPEAPLPGLSLQGYGPIPLPLAERDVDAICKEQTEGDDGIIPQVVKSVDGGSALIGQWEMKNGNIQMRNPAWYPFVQKIAVRAAEYLGINSDAGAVGAKLVKARLLTAGASMPPHKDIPNRVGSFGKLLICPPASHCGGNLLLSYGGRTRKFITEDYSRWSYSYVAWYTDADLELKPLESGHMLMLEYDLVLPSPGKVRSLADMYSEKGKLQDQLAKWNSAVTKENTTRNRSYPTLLAHVCDTIYESKSLSFGVLQGSDRFRAAYLKDSCATLHMGLYIANLDRTLEGFCEDFYLDDYCMTGESEDSILLTKIVDLNGNTVGSNLALEKEDNFVASDPFDCEPDSEDIDRHHALVTYYFRRTVLVMIPSVAKAEWLDIESQEDRPNKRKRDG